MAVLPFPRRDPTRRHDVSHMLALLRLETRRNTGLVCFPLLVVLGVTLAWSYLPVGIELWSMIDKATRQTLVFLGPLMAGIAAWMAGRNGRRQMDDVLATTPCPAATRDLATWGATAVWGVLAYVTIAAILATRTLPTVTWFTVTPLLRLVEGLLALVACTTLGYAAGVFIRSRFTAPFIALLGYIAHIVPVYATPSVQYLSPISFNMSFRVVFFDTAPSYSAARIGWFGGLAALGVLAMVLTHRRTSWTWITLAGVGVITTLAAGRIVRAGPNAEEARWATYTPLCQPGQVVEICVHPAYRAMLPDMVPIVDKVAAPVAGIAGLPPRAEQYPMFTRSFPPGVMPFALYDRKDTEATIARQVAESVAKDWSATWARNGDTPIYPLADPIEQAQAVVGDWLYAQAGYPLKVMGEDGGYQVYQFSNDSQYPEVQAAFQRFAALDPTVRRAWLETYLADLRAGTLTLEDLP